MSSVSQVTGTTPELRNTHFSALRVKDAVCDRLAEKRGGRPDVDPQHADARIGVSLARGRVSFSLDLSVEKRFPHGISLFFKGTNLLNTPSRIYIKNLSEYNNNYPRQDASKGYTLIEEECEGASFLLGVRYKL